MEKIIEQLNWRYATKVFDPNKKLSQEQVDTLVEVLRLTPSSMGLQPWNFVVVEDPDLRDLLVPASWDQTQVRDASHLIVLCRKLRFEESDVDAYIEDLIKTRGETRERVDGYLQMMKRFIAKMGPDARNIWMEKQVFIALGNLLTACALLGIDACPMEGISKPDYDTILDFKDLGITTVVACPVGYRDVENDKYANYKKVRFPKEEVTTFI